jgi:hypothetical protein
MQFAVVVLHEQSNVQKGMQCSSMQHYTLPCSCYLVKLHMHRMPQAAQVSTRPAAATARFDFMFTCSRCLDASSCMVLHSATRLSIHAHSCCGGVAWALECAEQHALQHAALYTALLMLSGEVAYAWHATACMSQH